MYRHVKMTWSDEHNAYVAAATDYNEDGLIVRSPCSLFVFPSQNEQNAKESAAAEFEVELEQVQVCR